MFSAIKNRVVYTGQFEQDLANSSALIITKYHFFGKSVGNKWAVTDSLHNSVQSRRVDMTMQQSQWRQQFLERHTQPAIVSDVSWAPTLLCSLALTVLVSLNAELVPLWVSSQIHSLISSLSETSSKIEPYSSLESLSSQSLQHKLYILLVTDLDC